MSKPITSADDPLHTALCELISGMSALNMPPEPRQHAPEEFYLSRVDQTAYHAMEHFQAAAKLLNEAMADRDRLQYEIYKLRSRPRG